MTAPMPWQRYAHHANEKACIAQLRGHAGIIAVVRTVKLRLATYNIAEHLRCMLRNSALDGALARTVHFLRPRLCHALDRSGRPHICTSCSCQLQA